MILDEEDLVTREQMKKEAIRRMKALKIRADIINALSVSCYEDDWKYEQSLIDNGWAMAYTVNVTKPDYSESGSVRLFNEGGLLERWG